MNERAVRPWLAPVAVGALLVVVFVVLIAVSATLRQYWPFLVLSAAAAAVPFLVWAAFTTEGPAAERTRALPVAAAAQPSGPRHHRPAALRGSAVTVPKASAAGGENEDAYGIDAGTGYAAVADGASSSFRAGDWAQALCTTFLARRPLDGSASTSWIADATAAFGSSSDPGAATQQDWWSSDAAQRGAHAAFTGLAVLQTEQGLVWRATSVGDCVLVHLRPEHGGPPIVTAFPIAHSAAFPQNPALLSSAVASPPPVASIDGVAAIGDVWLLMTDELARWTLRRHESGDPAWAVLAGGSAADVRALIESARSEDGVADDDMTVVRCEAVPAE